MTILKIAPKPDPATSQIEVKLPFYYRASDTTVCRVEELNGSLYVLSVARWNLTDNMAVLNIFKELPANYQPITHGEFADAIGKIAEDYENILLQIEQEQNAEIIRKEAGNE